MAINRIVGVILVACTLPLARPAAAGDQAPFRGRLELDK